MYSAVILFITSAQQGSSSSHSESVLRAFKKRINLLQKDKYSTLKAEIYNQGDSKVVNLTERELKIICKKYVLQVYPRVNREIPPQPPPSSPQVKMNSKSRQKQLSCYAEQNTAPYSLY
jgi:hypothetical protein